ncbi:hypothetical protein PVK06_018577 [Gossypium arboreum]|uniref:Retrotransposon gag domain-containing protein n=1 Tax=Gossypium arboreum TaxID=29729 RepID=A0ABR0PHH9_GOSAR|nr:hypothetical protein PVK06_018577 [Gossypium arboreum]
MTDNQNNLLPPVVTTNPVNQDPAPRTMYDYAKPTLTGTELSIDEDPNTYLVNFLEFCDTFKINGISDNAICLRLFPFSLRNKAKQWLNSLPRGLITTWEQITEKMDLETLYDAWERYNNLLRRCPHHGLPLWLQVQTFYNGVNPSTRQLIDTAAGRMLNNKTTEEA